MTDFMRDEHIVKIFARLRPNRKNQGTLVRIERSGTRLSLVHDGQVLSRKQTRELRLGDEVDGGLSLGSSRHTTIVPSPVKKSSPFPSFLASA